MQWVHMRQRPPSLWPAHLPVPSPLDRLSPICLLPWPSALQALNLSHSVSSRCSTVALPSTSAVSPRAHRSPASSLDTAYRRVLRPLRGRGIHQGPMPQAKAKGGRKPPPHRSFGYTFRPHNLGSYLLLYLSPFGPPLISSYRSMRLSMSSVSTLHTTTARQIRAQINTMSTLRRCSAS